LQTHNMLCNCVDSMCRSHRQMAYQPPQLLINI
jgi:hypothetical protein